MYESAPLENQSSAALTSLFRLGKEVPLKYREGFGSDRENTGPVVARLAALPEVATWTLENFVPEKPRSKPTGHRGRGKQPCRGPPFNAPAVSQ